MLQHHPQIAQQTVKKGGTLTLMQMKKLLVKQPYIIEQYTSHVIFQINQILVILVKQILQLMIINVEIHYQKLN